jgi:hypothetical protein
MPEMLGMALLVDMLSKNRRNRHEFEELRDNSRTPRRRLAAAMGRWRLRWVR